MMATTSLHPYDVVRVTPGSSVTFIDEFDARAPEIDVLAPDVASKLAPIDLIVARVVPRGISGRPELEGDVLFLDRLNVAVREMCEDMAAAPDARADLTMSGACGPLWYRLWQDSPPWWWSQQRPF